MSMRGGRVRNLAPHRRFELQTAKRTGVECLDRLVGEFCGKVG
jgi:hypothetical protein